MPNGELDKYTQAMEVDSKTDKPMLKVAVDPARSLIKGRKEVIQDSTINVEESLKYLEFDPQYTNACGFVTDGDYAYIAMNTYPATVHKVDLETFEILKSVTLPTDQTRTGALALHGDYVVHGDYSNPCTFTVLNKDDLSTHGSIAGIVETVNDKYIRHMFSDGNYVYALTDTLPMKMIRIDPVALTREDGITANSGEDNSFSFTYLNGYVYAGSQTTPAQVVKFNPRKMTRESAVTLGVGTTNLYAMVNDGEYIYAISAADPLIVTKIDPETMTEVDSYTGVAGQMGGYSATTDGQYLYVGTWNDPTEILKIDGATMTLVSKKTISVAYPGSLRFKAPYIYSACDMNPAAFFRLLY